MATVQKFDTLQFRFTPNEKFLDEAFCKRAAAAFDKGGTKTEVAAKLKVSPAIAHLAAQVHWDGPISFKSQEDLGKKVVKERQNGKAWANIGARAGGLSEGRVERLYEEASGEEYTTADIGRGGRPKINDTDRKPATAKKAAAKRTTGKAAKDGGKKTASKKTTKKAAPKKAASGGAVPTFGDKPNAATVGKKLNGKTVTVNRPGGKTEDFGINEVVAVVQSKKTEKWGAKVTTTDGKERTFALDALTAVA